MCGQHPEVPGKGGDEPQWPLLALQGWPRAQPSSPIGSEPMGQMEKGLHQKQEVEETSQ